MLQEHAQRLFWRYQCEIIEPFNVCPFALPARRDSAIEVRVIAQREPDVATLVDIVESFAETNTLDIGFIVCPLVADDRRAFDARVDAVRTHYTNRYELQDTRMALATFHPEATLDASNPGALIPFWRRSPDPTIQVIRLSTLERLRRRDGSGTRYVAPQDKEQALASPVVVPLHERINQANFDTLATVGSSVVCQRIDAIISDRNQTYATLGFNNARLRKARPT